MIKSVLFSLLAVLPLLTGCSSKKSETSISSVQIIPQPVNLVTGNEVYELPENISILAATPEATSAAIFLSDFFKSKNLSVTNQSNSERTGEILLIIKPDTTLGEEGYTLSVNSKGVSIEANAGSGLFYGVQSLIQIISTDGKQIPYVEITDYPRFSYRGLHLDVGRHMFPIEFIKKYIDLMARHKFNRFHWHLTEDQGWRIEIKKYPKLQEVAAYRKETLIGHAGEPETFDGKRYGGYYTQEQIKEVVQYATDRYVTIIPEIELPGHSQAALAAYPELGCTGGPYETVTKWGVFEHVYCTGKEETFKFLEGVLDEVTELFPGQYIHIGGDECPKTNWKNCTHCQKRMKSLNLKDEHELQGYFVQRIEKYLNNKGKQIIGWDEILEGGLAPNATVMSWRGEEGGIAAAKQKHNVIMTPGNWCYFDHYQDSSKTEPLAIGGLTSVSEVYSYEPLPSQLTSEEAKYILGAQANLWTEYITTPEHAEYMAYPRACALAEVVWSPKESRNLNDFFQRMQTHFIRLDEWNVNSASHIRKEIKKAN
jgi:hexosaminidase